MFQFVGSGSSSIPVCNQSFSVQQVTKPVSPRINFLAKRSSLSAPPREKYPFCDFHEDNDYGFFILHIDRRHKTVSSNVFEDMPKGKQIGRVHEFIFARRQPIKVKIIQTDLADLSPYSVEIVKSKRFGKLFTRDVSFTHSSLAIRHTVMMLMWDLTNSKKDSFFHFFPKYLLSKIPIDKVIKKIDLFLRQDFQSIVSFGFPSKMHPFKMQTNGQAIYAMILKRMELKRQTNVVNMRLLILCLTKLSMINDIEQYQIMIEMYKWLVLDTCDSCLEKVLISDMPSSSELYDLVGFGGEPRPFRISRFKLTYSILKCKSDMTFYPYSLKRLSHGAFSVSGFRDRSSVIMQINGEEVEFAMPTSYCVALRVVIDRVIRASRAWCFGHPEHILAWFRDIYLTTGSFNIVNIYILDLIESWRYLPPLRSCVMTLVITLYYGIVPKYVKNQLHDADVYDSILAKLLNSNPVDHSGVLGYLFDERLSRYDTEVMLNDSNRILTLKGLCGL